MEAFHLGAFMVSACLFTVLIEHQDSPVRQVLGDPLLRRVLIGIAMGLTAISLVYSPWGKQSGAHFNPAVTLTFLRLGKIAPWDAAFYVVAHFVGATVGVIVAAGILGDLVADPSVRYAVTTPGPAGAGVAFGAEMAISFGLMTTVLVVSNRAGIARLTGLFAGTLVAAYIAFEAPLSGMSMNPARTFGSALPAGVWTAFWVYLAAPTLAMLAAAEVYLRFGRKRTVACAKLHHQNEKPCLFCEYHGGAPEPFRSAASAIRVTT
jgi:aquaporin Z